MEYCSSGKNTYLSPEMAEEALVEAWIKYDFKIGQGPVSIYHCDECGKYHFTSTGEMNKRLADLQASGELEKMRMAYNWERKLGR